MKYLLPIFIGIPVIEMYLLIRVGQWLGPWPTIALVLLTAVIGLALLKRQGLSTLLRANQKIEQGDIPAEEMVEGILLAIGGALLLTPGFFTDAFGFFCLIPFTRSFLARRLVNQGMFQAQQAFYQQRGFQAGSFQQRDNIIEGEFTETTTSRPENLENDEKN